MEPELRPGDWALLLPGRGRLPRVGEVVVAEHPDRPGFELVKRVAAVSPQRGLVWLAGDNRDQTSDSDQFGPVPAGLLVGRVVAVLGPRAPRLLRRRPDRLWG